MTQTGGRKSPHLLSADEIAGMDEITRPHPINPNAKRFTRSLSDALGMRNIGVHLVRIETGSDTTEYHFHNTEEEFVYILSGRGIAEIGDQKFEVGAGDFMGFIERSQPHIMRNPFDEDLVYLMGGQREAFDVVEYPRLNKRLFRTGSNLQIVKSDDVDTP